MRVACTALKLNGIGHQQGIAKVSYYNWKRKYSEMKASILKDFRCWKESADEIGIQVLDIKRFSLYWK